MAWRGLAIQGWRRAAADSGSGCYYRIRDKDGLRCCPVGWLIPDDKLVFGGSPLASEPDVLSALADHLQPIPDGGGGFLTDLQRVHDSTRNGVDLQGNMRHFAEKHGLKIPPPARWET